MILKNLNLRQFRNFSDESVKVDARFVLIIGENGQGKTNLLESIHFVGTGKSWRTKNHNELIKINEEYSSVYAEFSKNTLNKKVEITLNNNGEKLIKVNGKGINAEREYFGEINIVNFSPEDINIISGPPVIRRNFINFFMSQFSRLYKEHLMSYNRIVSQRNRILYLMQKNGQSNNQQIKMFEVWTEQLIEEGIWITEKRIYSLMKFAEYFKKFYSLLNNGAWEITDKVMVLYRSSLGFCKELNSEHMDFVDAKFFNKDFNEIFRSRLDELKEKEIKYQETIIGPHRDDIIFVLDGFDGRKFSSRGEQRLLSLALKLASCKIIEETLNETPIILIDDVLSELDENRKSSFLKNLNNGAQIFIAGTDERIFSAFDSNSITKLKVKNGKVFC